MNIQRWAPFSAFTSLEQEMHSMLDRVGARPWLEGFGWKPDTDIYRDDHVLVVQVELPGIDPDEDLRIDIEDNVLRIAGERVQPETVSERDRYVTERRFGSFRREVMLPDGIEPDEVTAVYGNGILTVQVGLPSVPGEEGIHRTRISIDVAD